MAESIGADLASGLVGKLVSLAANEVIQTWNLDKALETLRKRFQLISALLHDAHTKKLTMSTVEKWFDQLEDFANDTEALLDELAYDATRQNVEKRRKVRDFFIPSKNPLIYRRKVAVRIKSINASFDENFNWAKDLGFHAVDLLNSTVQPRGILYEPPFEDTTLIVGRDKDITDLIQTVCKNNDQDLRVVALVGMGGQGKTTLARMLFNSEDVNKLFPKRMWITISDEFEFVNILNEMVESLTSTKSRLKNPQGLINELEKKLKGEKFLLVLDDVWNEESVKWGHLRNSLLGVSGAKGSCVVVTTRKQRVIDAMENCVPYPVEKLQGDDSYELFKKIAFSDGGVLDVEPFAELGKSMVNRCGGLPLAIKALGGMLRSKKSEQEWRNIQNSEIWTSQDELPVLPSLRLSYDNLPYSSLKRCFVYCSIIPKDTRIYKDKLIQIWMTLGFILPPLGSDDLMEDIGIKFFNILLWHSLLQDIKRDEFGNIESCKMHDLVHDLAQKLSKHHSVTVNTVPDLNNVSKATYLRLDKHVLDKNLTILKKRDFEKVRLLSAGASVFRDVLPYITHLTVLVLNTEGVNDNYAGEFPKSLRNMKYIKHLDISSTRCKVPSYITELYNLQTLRVWDLKELPKKFCNLINLRHLYIRKSYGEKCMLNGIERLTCLQTLPHFVVSNNQNCLLAQLEELHNLRGKVELYGLSDVGNMQEASKAKLCAKTNIESLLLNWKSDYERVNKSEEERVFEGLEPHANLKKLIIKYFMGKKLASWITKMNNLVKISLSHCEGCEEFPSLGQLPKLREMQLGNMHNVRIIGSHVGLSSKLVYPSLTKLILENLPKLEEWIEPDMRRFSKDQSCAQVFPKLEQVIIDFCSKLTRMPDSSFPCLKDLKISNSKMILEQIASTKVSSLMSLKFEKVHMSEAVFEELCKINSQSLRNLYIYRCEGLTFVTVGAALENLTVWNCTDITSINAVKDEIPSLRNLKVIQCPILSVLAQSLSSTIERLEINEISKAINIGNSFPNLTHLTLDGFGNSAESLKTRLEFDDRHVSAFSALTTLDIVFFKRLKAIPDTIANLPSLENLTIWNCEELESLPTFEQSHAIRKLEIYSCPILEERCKKEIGAEWYKIKHIPVIKYPGNDE